MILNLFNDLKSIALAIKITPHFFSYTRIVIRLSQPATHVASVLLLYSFFINSTIYILRYLTVYIL